MKRTTITKLEQQHAIAIGIDATFLSINSTAYNVQKLSIQKGQTVKLNLHTGDIQKIDWFANNDAVLDIQANNKEAIIKTTAVGTSLIELQIHNRPIRSIEIEVVGTAATKVELVFSTPIHK